MLSTSMRLFCAAVVALALGISVKARASSIVIRDLDNPDGTITLTLNGKVVAPDRQVGELAVWNNLQIPDLNLTSVGRSVDLTEEGNPNYVSDNITMTLTANNDGKTSSLMINFTSDLETSLLATAPTKQVEDVKGNEVGTIFFGAKLSIKVFSIPEPSSVMMMGIGTVGMLVFIRRTRRHRLA
jgi:PEP-CTERM motif